MRLFEAQAALFAPRPSRLALLGLDLPPAGQLITVNVWRNHSFESVESLTAPYFAFRGWRADFRLGGYDDTLMFSGRQEADADILWLDSSRFFARSSLLSDWLQWLEERLRALRSGSKAPIILATWVEGSQQAEAVTSSGREFTRRALRELRDSLYGCPCASSRFTFGEPRRYAD